MSALDREVMFKPGATFFEQRGVVMFRYQADASSVIGPRPATVSDKIDHAFEWEQFNLGRLPQLDHDGDGFPGGSAPIRPVSDEHVHVPADYEEVTPPRRGRPKKAVA